ncbi:SdpI family protein [Pseudoclavibacter albus]|uniref:SdpI family protein n=1 Tax=Pseudoclavibacter albus TaxID=272241 RepID=UPI000823FEB2|nr:SdpI family protein [Pseudoclavibacter alba]
MDGLQAPPVMSAVVTAAILVIGNSLVILQIWLAKRGVLPVGGFAGLRTPATNRSQDAWEAGHEAAFPWSLVVNGIAVVSAAATLVVRETPLSYLIVIGLAVLASLVGTVGAMILAHRAAKRTLR